MARSITKSRFAGFQSRLRVQAANNLGIIMSDQMTQNNIFREPELDLYDAYYENRQYDDLPTWENAQSQDGEYIPVRKRKPRIIYNLAKVLVDKVAAKLIGSSVFPKFIVEDDPEDTEFFRIVMKASHFRRHMLEPMKHMLRSGSCLVRFSLINGVPIIEHYNAKFCYPTFDESGELELVDIRYVYDDVDDKDSNGKPRTKWYKLTLSKTSDILYDNPIYQEGQGLPKFVEVERNDHNFGFVQAEWFRTGKFKFSHDGLSLYGDILDFIDEMNYSMSQTSQATSYNQDPQVVASGIDEDELDTMIRSSQKMWNVGRDGEVTMLEAGMEGVKQAGEVRADFRNRMLEVVRVVLHDPEKIVGNAQAASALEILHAPLLELIDELRTQIEPELVNLLVKISMVMLLMNAEGFDTVLETPEGFMPQSADITLQWPAIFPLTLDDKSKRTAAAVSAAGASIISRETATRFLATDFGIEDVEEELAKIAAQPVLNPFGSFGGM